jgi:putative membrane protein
MIKLSDADRQRIADAITAAETKTTGEVFCVLAKSCGDYREATFAWSACIALVLPMVLIPFGLTADKLPLPWFGSGWEAGQASAVNMTVTGALMAYAMAQIVVFILALIVFSLPAVRLFVTPKSRKRERVRRAALEQFFAKALHLSEGRTGVLIFASAAERMVEIVADENIHLKAGEEAWEDTAALVTKHMGAGNPADGFVEAIGHVGTVLANHFPSTGPNPNQLPNTLIEL